MRYQGWFILAALLAPSLAGAVSPVNVSCQSYYEGYPVRCVVIQGTQESTVGCQQLNIVYGNLDDPYNFPAIPPYPSTSDLTVIDCDAVDEAFAYCEASDSFDPRPRGNVATTTCQHIPGVYAPLPSAPPAATPAEDLHHIRKPKHN